MKSILVVHGDKGGVGKSTFAALVADYAVHTFGKAALVEGDSTIFDVAPRFENTKDMNIMAVDLARPDMSEDAIVALFDEIERGVDGDSHIIINTPASAGKTLDAQADLIVPAIEGLGYKLVVCWMVDVGEDSARLSMQSKICELADLKVAVRNTRLKSVDALPWATHKARTAWLQSGGLEVTLPGLTERVVSKLREIQMPLSEIVTADVGLSVIERQAVKRWVDTAWAEGVAPIYQTLGE
ncbi:P-loop NTPase family protein [Acidithiobacillus ferrivorans]|uniref:CobQ/CobB/MinD/ParA nucleotide binding domain-containing protein n=1 Tax=Acidithiobacillus ferrivorans TaxID=160808 RepID=A0A7T5BH85_9PROT|nr:hypothetical protein [Acidithiobacillus ferrivorans]QQD72310.1 hypothetical protein H2515_13030 [Acidithiobacillus ferrivorans]